MQIFHRSTNTISRATIFGAVFVIAALFWAMAEIQRSPYVTYSGVVKPQPVAFSHQHHVTGLGIDCRYCHRVPEKYLRPRDQVFNMRYEGPSSDKPVTVDGRDYIDQLSLGRDLRNKYKLRTERDITSCSTCHR